MEKRILVKVVPYTEEGLSPTAIQLNKRIRYVHFNTQTLLLKCGCHEVKTSLNLVHDHDSDIILKIGSSISKELRLPSFPFISQLLIASDDSIVLGPVFAILTEIRQKDDGISLNSIHSFCEEIALYCEANGILFYVFSLQSIQNDQVTGYMYTNNKWINTTVPIPNVIHNRIHSRKKEKSNEFFQFIHYLQSKQIPYFNDHYLNKWEAYTILKDQLHLHPYLPETKMLTTKEELELFLTQFKQVFIKPIHGAQGKRIIRITRKDEKYTLDYTTFSGEIEKYIPSFSKLFYTLRPRLVKEAFIIQQGITFIQYNQNQLDFRILCHRNKTGKWKTTSIVARVSNDESFVSNIARGGQIVNAKDVLTKFFDAPHAHQILKLLKELAIEISTAISNAVNGYYGEFGIDLGIDKNGCPWIIEVNTKPSKNLDTMEDSVKTRPSAKAIVHYALYLSHQNMT